MPVEVEGKLSRIVRSLRRQPAEAGGDDRTGRADGKENAPDVSEPTPMAYPSYQLEERGKGKKQAQI